nr:MAG TPA: hypothetical protein [Caudoviricetes sp.]
MFVEVLFRYLRSLFQSSFESPLNACYICILIYETGSKIR